ncbi:hypothetical protein [Paraburkholderia sp. C35]|uniref:hypothetical protein n=1 Tax=Paraburkholderia sp. C35 TaxID=2126993 RepID=UPI000D6896E2|nr:hypothetical protein [Paraburkholderia sp. C35]
MHYLNRTVALINRMLPVLGIALTLGNSATVFAASQAAPSAEASKQAADMQAASGDHFIADDPVKVRDMLARQMPSTDKHSITDRIRNLAREPYDRLVHGNEGKAGDGQRTFLFMIPAPHGILYRANTDMLSVNVPLSGDEHPNTILLYQKVDGQSGRGLVIAPDAKAKGFIQKIDSIDLAAESAQKTTARGRIKLSQAAFEQADDNFAIVLVCTLEPPYLTEVREHDDPTDEEPTDITRRTSTLHANVQAVWLVNQKDNTVLAKGLRLGK